MMQNNPDFSKAQLLKILQKPETKALMSRLQQLDANAIEQAARLASDGNAAAAKDLLSPLLKDEQVQNLTQKLRDENG